MKKVVFVGGLVAWAVSAFAMEEKQTEFSMSENSSALKFVIKFTDSIESIQDAPGNVLVEKYHSSVQKVVAIYEAKQRDALQKFEEITQALREEISKEHPERSTWEILANNLNRKILKYQTNIAGVKNNLALIRQKILDVYMVEPKLYYSGEFSTPNYEYFKNFNVTLMKQIYFSDEPYPSPERKEQIMSFTVKYKANDGSISSLFNNACRLMNKLDQTQKKIVEKATLIYTFLIEDRKTMNTNAYMSYDSFLSYEKYLQMRKARGKRVEDILREENEKLVHKAKEYIRMMSLPYYTAQICTAFEKEARLHRIGIPIIPSTTTPTTTPRKEVHFKEEASFHTTTPRKDSKITIFRLPRSPRSPHLQPLASSGSPRSQPLLPSESACHSNPELPSLGKQSSPSKLRSWNSAPQLPRSSKKMPRSSPGSRSPNSSSVSTNLSSLVG